VLSAGDWQFVHSMDKFLNKYRIPSTRLQTWNYGWNAAYFVTICTRDHVCYFGEVVDGQMVLSEKGVIADILWHEILNHAKQIELGEFVVMPNHIHGILILNEPPDVETTHALSLPRPESPGGANDVENPHASRDVETTHALSLPRPESPGGANDVENPHASRDVEATHALSLRDESPDQPPIGQSRFQHQGRNTVSSIVGSYKSAVSKHAHRLGLGFAWQSRFYDRIIRNENEFRAITDYIINNPLRWEDDKFK